MSSLSVSVAEGSVLPNKARALDVATAVLGGLASFYRQVPELNTSSGKAALSRPTSELSDREFGGQMNPDIESIKNPQIQIFYSLWWPQHKILYDFILHLTEEQFDYRMVDLPSRKADTPRESLAHILYVQLVYLNAVRTGRLEFKSMGTEHYRTMTKEQLLAEWECIDEQMFAYLTAEVFDSQCQVEVPWGGKMNAVDLLFFLRDHEILHIGWNLAVMDHLNVPRYESLIQYWGP